MIARTTKKPKSRSKYDDDDEYDMTIKPKKVTKKKVIKKRKVKK